MEQSRSRAAWRRSAHPANQRSLKLQTPSTLPPHRTIHIGIRALAECQAVTEASPASDSHITHVSCLWGNQQRQFVYVNVWSGSKLIYVRVQLHLGVFNTEQDVKQRHWKYHWGTPQSYGLKITPNCLLSIFSVIFMSLNSLFSHFGALQPETLMYFIVILWNSSTESPTELCSGRKLEHGLFKKWKFSKWSLRSLIIISPSIHPLFIPALSHLVIGPEAWFTAHTQKHTHSNPGSFYWHKEELYNVALGPKNKF